MDFQGIPINRLFFFVCLFLLFYSENGQTLEQAVQRYCEVSILGNTQNPALSNLL